MEVRKYQPGDLDVLVKNIRERDRNEIHALGCKVRPALEESLYRSDIIGSVYHDDELAYIFGASPRSVVTNCGTPWLIGTDVINGHIAVHSIGVLMDIFSTKYNRLENIIHEKNLPSYRVLKRAGFQFSKPFKVKTGERFMLFSGEL